MSYYLGTIKSDITHDYYGIDNVHLYKNKRVYLKKIPMTPGGSQYTGRLPGKICGKIWYWGNECFSSIEEVN